jgi:hypothetical protein
LRSHGGVALLLLGLGSLCRWPLKAVAIVATAALFAGSYVVGWGAILGWPTSMFPQPGLARDLAARGALVPLGGDMRAWFEENFAAGAYSADLATFAGPDGTEEIYGVIFGTDVKSLVWYSPEAFEETG